MLSHKTTPFVMEDELRFHFRILSQQLSTGSLSARHRISLPGLFGQAEVAVPGRACSYRPFSDRVPLGESHPSLLPTTHLISSMTCMSFPFPVSRGYFTALFLIWGWAFNRKNRINITGAIWRGVNPGVCCQGFLRLETAHISNLPHELRTKGRVNAEHFHDNGIFR